MQSLTYDASGNLTGDGLFQYGWDAAGRLMTATAVDHTSKLSFTYDAQGRRITKTCYTWSAGQNQWVTGQTIQFAYAGWNLLAEFDQASGKLLRSYTWGLNAGGGDHPIPQYFAAFGRAP